MKYGVIAGNGRFPVIALETARKQGDEAVVLAIKEEASADVGHEPTAEALRAVLMTWITRGAAWGGPIVGWMRDLRDRLESRA